MTKVQKNSIVRWKIIDQEGLTPLWENILKLNKKRWNERLYKWKNKLKLKKGRKEKCL